MPSGFRNAAGSDFDDVFDLYVQGDQGAASGYRSNDGNDLHRRYAPLAYGAKAPDVGYRDPAGSDLSNRWARKGTAQYSLPFQGGNYSSHNQARTSATGSATARVELLIQSNGTWRVLGSRVGGGNNSTDELASGTWLPAGANAGSYAVQFGNSDPSPGGIGNTAPSYQSCAATQSIAISVSVPSASTDRLSARSSVACYLRNPAGAVSVTTCTLIVSSQGYI